MKIMIMTIFEKKKIIQNVFDRVWSSEKPEQIESIETSCFRKANPEY